MAGNRPSRVEFTVVTLVVLACIAVAGFQERTFLYSLFTGECSSGLYCRDRYPVPSEGMIPR